MSPTPPGDEVPTSSLYVITLGSSSMPMPSRASIADEIAGLSIFHSRVVEDGRERFRLHIGYFDSAQRAHEVLAVVRRHYPAAWITSAPRTDLGSLDDTLNTAFQVVGSAHARGVASEKLPATVAAGATEGVSEEFVNELLDANPQRYVVQLDATIAPIDSRKIPRPDAFYAYTLYTVRMMRSGGAQHGLRLGFFDDIEAARRVAEECHANYPHAIAIPASHREYSKTIEISQQRALKALMRAEPPPPRTKLDK
jgi:hypothetical protein